MTDAQQPADLYVNSEVDTNEPAEFVPMTEDEMFTKIGRTKPGRVSAADKAAQEKLEERQYASYRTLLAAYLAQDEELSRQRTRGDRAERLAHDWENAYRSASKELRDLREQRETNHHRYALVLRTAFQLACLMPSEFTPNLRQVWSTFTFSCTNKYGKFELLWTDDGPTIEITPVDKKRRSRTFKLDDNGITTDTVLGIKGLLGLPDDGPLPARAEKDLRNEHPPTSTAHDAIKKVLSKMGLDMSGIQVEILGECDDPNCPFCGGKSSGLFGGMESWPRD